jgi:hypothetical protein
MICAVIPTRYHPPELAVLIEQIDEAIVLESDDYDHRIYRMWNAGVEKARSLGATEIAILNDDITILPGTLPLMARVLRSDDKLGVVYPDINAPWTMPEAPATERTEGTWGAGGMTGFCFMFKADLGIKFDEQFNWWYSDDRFEHDVRALGSGIARIVGLPIRHVADGSASKDWERLAPLIEDDRSRWEYLERNWSRVE